MLFGQLITSSTNLFDTVEDTYHCVRKRTMLCWLQPTSSFLAMPETQQQFQRTKWWSFSCSALRKHSPELQNAPAMPSPPKIASWLLKAENPQSSISCVNFHNLTVKKILAGKFVLLHASSTLPYFLN